MKKLLLTGLVGLGLVVGANASVVNEKDVTSSDLIGDGYLRVYGLGLKIGYPNSNLKDETYGGAGIQFENDFSNIVIEYGSDYKKGSAVLKYDITTDLYIKGGLGILEREMLILGVDKDVTQTSGGASLGYGDEKSYNIEAGHVVSKLEDAAAADGYSRISYIEVVGKHSFGEYLTFDAVGIVKNTNVFNKNYDDYQAELGWFATDDVRTFVGHDSVDHDRNDYAIRAGVQYAFATAEFSPYLRATANTDKNVNVGLEYSQGIANRSLKMRDFFENAVGTSDIVAQVVAPGEFADKVAVQDNTPAANNAPTGESFSVDAGNASTFTVDLASHINDADGDSMTVSYVGSGVSSGDIVIDAGNTGITGTNATITVTTGSGNGYIDYTVTDGTGTSATYRVTYNNLFN